jgi:CheY-like chemotaxis protein/anti-sigma regulatory factor (Ser/Thr protein kinase)
MVVDDDPDQRMLVSRLLAKHGITQVVTAANAAEAVAAAAEHQPHVILLDLAMPGRSGFEVLPDLHGAAPTAIVVILSNLPRHRLAAKLVERGAVGYVEKKVAPQHLITEILIAAALTELARDGMSLGLPAETSSSRTARRFIRNLLDTHGQDLIADVELLVSELVTNAVLHASSAPRLEVQVSAGAVRVAVHDDDPSLPERRVPDADRPGGRGLNMVEQLASRWGAEAHDDGKVVWFEIDRAAP